MRRLVENTAGALALAALLALLVPASVVPSNDHVMVSAFAGGLAVTPTAAAEGRWKLGGDGSCFFDPDDSGPDQCSANGGRWKLGGDGSCVFDANDSGPNQCEPPAEAPAADARASSPGKAFHRGV